MKYSFISILLGLVLIFKYSGAGHEVLYGLKLLPGDIQPNQIAVVQFDTRTMGDYWNVSSRWNQAYCNKYDHRYVYLSTSKDCFKDGFKLANPWCKVKAMAAVDRMVLPGIRTVIFLDSDSLITVNYSMSFVLTHIQRELKWNVTERPIAFNQDGPGWACKHAFKIGYKVCLNSGAVVWMKGDPLASSLLTAWWDSAGEAYETSPNRFTSKWRVKWPWEQAQQYEMFIKFEQHVQLLSFPSLPFLPWTSTSNPKAQYPTDSVEPWCFSHWPGAGCFITHFCSSKTQKAKMKRTYDLPHRDDISVSVVSIDDL